MSNDTYNIAADRLRSFVERIERLEEEKRGLAGDIKDIYAEAKSAGFDTKVLRRIVADRRRDPAELEEQEQLLDLYRRALGQLDGTPLGMAAVDKAAMDEVERRGLRKRGAAADHERLRNEVTDIIEATAAGLRAQGMDVTVHRNAAI